MRYQGQEPQRNKEQHYKNKSAYIMGQESKKENKLLNDNPFEYFSEEFKYWEDGFNGISIQI